MPAEHAGKAPRPSFVDRIGKLCFAGKDVATYLHQVPDDEGQRQKLREILDTILKESVQSKRRELPRIAQEMREALNQPPSLAAAELLMDGFDRLVKLWQSARSGLF